MTDTTLLIVHGRPAEALNAAAEQCAGERVAVLSLGAAIEGDRLPEGWQRLQAGDYADVEGLSKAFLAFLDRWPRQPLSAGSSFDELFRRRGGYSVWWTGPGRGRHPERGMFPILSALWVCDRALRAVVPRRVLIHAGDRSVATVLASRCRGRVPFEVLRSSARPIPPPWKARGMWLARSLARLPILPIRSLTRAWCGRLVQAFQQKPLRSRTDRAVIFVCELSRDIRTHGDEVTVGFWNEIREALLARDRGLTCRYRVVYRRSAWLFHPAWRMLGRLPGALPADEGYSAVVSWARALPKQVASLLRYVRLERTSRFQESFGFAGADLAPLYVPRLRRAVARSIDWDHAVAAAVRSLEAAGRVTAMLVVKEMYPSEMVTIAAARELGIPTVGVQHGSISPTHLIYTLPPGYVEGAPLPDYFAAYGEFARETVSVHGSYPADRVWVTGGARFDHLVTARHDPRAARAGLALPPAARILLVTTQSYTWFADVVRTVLEEARERDDWFVCIKTHPLRPQHVEMARRIAAEVGATNARVFQEGFDELLEASDVLISASSTTVLEAILAGRRTICVNFSPDPDQYPYAADGGSLPARSIPQLRQALETIFAPDAQAQLDDDRKRFLDRHAGPAAEGRAAATLAGLVAGLDRGAPLAVTRAP